MATWTDERKQEVIDAYLAGNPTESNSVELCKEIAAEFNESVNGIRMILMQAKVYVAKGGSSATKAKPGGGETTKTTTPRVSKEDQIAALRAAIVDAGKTPDDDILTKLTGKAATYFLSLLSE